MKKKEENKKVDKKHKKGRPSYFPFIEIEPERFTTFTVVKSD